MRLFLALDIDDPICERITRFVDGVRNFFPDARWVKAESLHVTLKFIGEQPDNAVEKIKRALKDISAATTEITFCGYGFFPTPKSARVFWIGMESGPQLVQLAAAIDERMANLGIKKEDRAFSPHLTLARAVGGSGSPRWRKGDGPNRSFSYLQEKLSALPVPEFGTMIPREFVLYQSQLSPKGSRYTKLARFALQS
ncbi:MAG TPA: RNA 2',3'-cyclic phosphodiesterase [Candidatus Sulfotelmatobacter sp.]|jgi:2'-5' RNA ligase|nr:RNA 2',3'-cyclic phosphodiesterase [Candidatus Sulfotelmatobacter sp.]